MNTYPFIFRNNEVTILAQLLVKEKVDLPFYIVMSSLLQYDVLTTESDATTRESATEIEDEELENITSMCRTLAESKVILEQIAGKLTKDNLATRVFEATERKLAILEAEQASRKLARGLASTEEIPAGIKFKHKDDLKVLVQEGQYKDWLYIQEPNGTWNLERKATAAEIEVVNRKKSS